MHVFTTQSYKIIWSSENVHLLQNVSSAPGCAFKANSSSPLTEIQFISGEPPSARAEVEKSDITVCGQQHGWGCGGMCRGFQRHLKNTLLTARSSSSNPKLLIFGAVWCLTQGPVVRKFAIAGEEYQRQGARIIF